LSKSSLGTLLFSIGTAYGEEVVENNCFAELDKVEYPKIITTCQWYN